MKKVEFTAYLMNYKNDKLGGSKSKKMAGLGKAPKPKKEKVSEDKNSEAYLKKVWMLRDAANGKALIARYKGEETDIIFPKQVGEFKIIGISDRGGKAPEIYSKITSVVIPEGYYSIGNLAFEGCSSLKTIEIPTTVEVIGDKAFLGCSSLESIVIPAAVDKIRDGYHEGKWMLRDCTMLKDIYVLNPSIYFYNSAWLRGCNDYIVHSLENSTVQNYVAKKNFKVLTEDEKKGFAKRYFEKPVKCTVFFDKKEHAPQVGTPLIFTFDITDTPNTKIHTITPECIDLGEPYVLNNGVRRQSAIIPLSEYLEGKVVSEPKTNSYSYIGNFSVEIEVKYKG